MQNVSLPYHACTCTIRVMQQELKEVPAGEMPSLPEPEPLDGKGDEILANEIGDMMIIVGDSLVKKYGKELNE